MRKRIAVIGLDCADPDLVFNQFWEELPNIRKIAQTGTYKKFESIIPPITVPAWMCMVTGKDPGELGIYGFRNRTSYDYSALGIANSTMVKYPTIWENIGQRGLKSIILGVPLTYPPKPLNGWLVSGFLAPDTEHIFTYPPNLGREIKNKFGKYILDVKGYRTNNQDWLLEQIYQMTNNRFEVAKYLVTTREWDFFMMVEMGPDRIHHGFWAHHDTTHPKHDPNSPYKGAIRDYYKFLDQKIGELLSVLPENTEIVVVSDHGIQKMDGGIAINEWLIREGLLKLKKAPPKPMRITEAIANNLIDWSRTYAWGMGGYYGRIFLNIKGREPHGIINPTEVDSFKNWLRAKIESMHDDTGKPLGNVTFTPSEVYRAVNNIPPDIIVYFGNLRWRSIGTIGIGQIHVHENDTGPDDANHAPFGIIATTFKDAPDKIMDFRNWLERKIKAYMQV